jgi:hypothetical protein
MKYTTRAIVDLLSIILLLIVVVLVISLPKKDIFPQEKSQKEDTDTFFIKLRYETSDDLVDQLDDLSVGKIYKIKCNDGKIRDIKLALIDRKLKRVGIIALVGTNKIDGNLGGKAYNVNAVGFVEIDWFKEHMVK